MTTQGKLLRRLACFLSIVLITSLSACNNGSGSSPNRETPQENENAGNLAFSINWEDDVQEGETTTRDVIDCVGRNVETITATLYNTENEVVAAGEWGCDRHEGTIENVPAPQEEITILLVGKDSDGFITYRGEKGGLTINAGSENDAGVIDVFRFIPAAISTTDTPNTIQWHPVNGAQGYRVVISPSEDLSNPAIDTLCEGPPYTAVGLTPGTVHYVKVYAQDNRESESAGSEMGSFTTLPLMGVPQNVTATGDILTVNLEWEGEEGAAYNVYWSTTSGVSASDYGGKFENLEAPRLVHENCQGNTAYYYVVTSVNSIGQESEISAEAATTAVGLPSGPANVSATAGQRRVILNWTAVDGFFYNVYWSRSPGVSKTEYEGKAEGIEAARFVHEGLDSVVYHYVVTAANGLGESDPMGEVSAGPGWITLHVNDDAHSDEYGRAIAVDAAGNSYFLGNTDTAFAGQPTHGDRDMLVIKNDAEGNRLWVKLLGTQAQDWAYSIDVDEVGNVYLVGTTWGDWEDFEYPNPFGTGTEYLFIIKLDTDGELLWITSLDTGSDTLNDEPAHISADTDGNCYVAGSIERRVNPQSPTDERTSVDVFLARYAAANGTQDWIRYLSSPEETEGDTFDETSHAITLDSENNIYITGATNGRLGGNEAAGGYDIFVAKYAQAEAAPQWVSVHGNTNYNYGHAIAVNETYCYVSGEWGYHTIHISQFNAEDGVHQWTQSLDSIFYEEESNSIALAPNGDLFFVGFTQLPEFDGQQNAGSGDYAFDVLLMAYDADGGRRTELSRLLGSDDSDYGAGIAIGADGYARIIGHTWGNLGGHENSGRIDAFTWKYYVGP
jgi:hypothetical protein